MIKAIIFDIDGVLLDSLEANTVFFQDLIEESGYKRPSKEEVSKVFHLTMWDAIKFLAKEKSESNIKKVWNLGHKFRYPVELSKMPKNSKEVIKNLNNKYKLGIVTSRIKRGVDIFFQISKLQKYFDVIVSFEDYSKPKPHPESLLIAVKKLKMKPEETVYIGDSESDIKAAKAAGMKIIVYSKQHLKDANLTIKSFKKLPSAIEYLQKTSLAGIPKILIEFDKKLPHFTDGRIDYSKSNEATVITCFVKYRNKILLLKRSNKVLTYKNKWNTVAGYLDELKPVSEKALEEIKEEIGISPKSVSILKIGKSFKNIDKDLNKTWFINPLLVGFKVKPKIRLDREHSEYRWIEPKELKSFDTVPGLDKSLRAVWKF